MWFWKKKKTPEKDNESFLRAVRYHMVDRRLYQRVQYPAVGAVGSLPSIQCEGQILDPLNISLGGLLLLNPPFKRNKSGEIFEFQLQWKKKRPEIVQEAELIRIYQGHWHFRFTKTDRRYIAEFPHIFKSGIRGATCVEFKQNQVPPGEHIVELWMSEQGDYALFQRPPTESTEIMTIHLDGKRFRFFSGRGLLTSPGGTGNKATYDGTPDMDSVDELLTFLVNFKGASPRIKRLVSEIIDYYYRTSVKNSASA